MFSMKSVEPARILIDVMNTVWLFELYENFIGPIYCFLSARPIHVPVILAFLHHLFWKEQRVVIEPNRFACDPVQSHPSKFAQVLSDLVHDCRGAMGSISIAGTPSKKPVVNFSTSSQVPAIADVIKSSPKSALFE